MIRINHQHHHLAQSQSTAEGDTEEGSWGRKAIGPFRLSGPGPMNIAVACNRLSPDGNGIRYTRINQREIHLAENSIKQTEEISERSRALGPR